MPEVSESKSEAVQRQAQQPKPVKKRAPTLYLIIAIKLLKGIFCVVLAVILYNLSDNNLPVEYQNLMSFMQRFLRLNPERRFWSDLAVTVGGLTEHSVLRLAAGTLLYSLFSLVEGVGLIFRVPWAGWLAIGESSFFIPLEIHELLKNPSWFVGVILVVNVGIVWYLYANRERLFRHHH